ncbi:hypothetical protein AAIA72_09610 [Hahella sp. SMD15-11]|uniref:Uncharacterized protein n=1 Tax=Thermohahella caldifontis TaxID=3142973 RepID=A0AB39URY5_9GAMM
MGWLQQLEIIKDTVQTGIDQTVESVERIHQRIGDAALDVLVRAGAPEARISALRERQQQILTIVYGTIREVNQSLGALATDLIDTVETGKVAAESTREVSERNDASGQG